MAEVGVLNLTIHDNSEEAGYGLGKLADALGRVKRAVGTGLNLSSVAEEVTKLAKTIQEARGTSTIVKNLGTMFNAINQFSKIKSFSIDTEKIRDLADNMIKLADAKEKVDAVTKSNAGLGDWRTSMNGVAEGTSKAVESVQKSVNTYESTMSDLTETARKSSDYLSRMAAMGVFGTSMPKSAQSPGQISMFEDLKSKVDEITQSYIEFEKTTEEYRYKAMDVMSIMDKPLEYMRDIYKTPTVSMEDYKNAIGAALPKVQQLSSEEMVAAAQAKIAKESIDGIIKTLEKPISYKGIKGFIDAMTGVAKGSQGTGLINASTSMFSLPEAAGGAFKKVEEATDGLIRVFDKASGSYREMEYSAEKQAETLEKTSESIQTAKDQIRQFTDLTKIPASGANGMFKNVSEEVQYLQGQLENAKTSMRQFNEVAANAEKQMKYGGPISKDELAFNLKHATEGFYQAAEAEQKYQRAIEDALSYARDYKEKLSTDADTSTALDPVTSAVEKLDDTVNEAANDGLENFKQGMEKIEEPANRVLSKIELLQNRAKFLKDRLRNLFSMPAKDEEGNDTGRDNAINETLLKISAVNEQIDKLINKAHDAQDALKFDSLKSGADNLQRAYGSEVVQNLVENYSEVDLLTMKLEGMKQALADDISQNKIDTQQIADRTIAIQNLRDKIEALIEDQEEAIGSTVSLGRAFGSLKDGMKKMFPTLSGLLKRFKSMAIMRSMRYLIRQLSAGFSEGVQNVYWYSKAIGSTFSTSMDSAAGSLLQMKNSIGAAVAPVIESLIPYLQVAVNWFITLVNYVNQFIALMRGQSTWTRAVYNTTDAYEDQTKKAKNASSAVKDLLADWDELNIIQSNSSSSGTGTDAAKDYLSMFEEVATFDNQVMTTVNNIKDVFGDVWGLAKKIAGVILGWKFANAFTGILATLGGLIGAVSIIGLTFDISTFFSKQFLETGDIGWLIGDLLTTLVGSYYMEKVLSKVLGGSIGEIAVPLTFGVSAIADIVTLLGDTDVGVLSAEALEQTAATAIKGSVVAGYIAKIAGGSTGQILYSAAAGALLTFGVVTNLNASVKAVQQGNITKETIEATALGSVAIGAGVGMIAKLAVPGVSAAQALGFGLYTGAAAALFTMGATIGVSATVNAIKGTDSTDETIKKAAISSALMGLSGAMIGKLFGASMLFGSVVGAAATIVTIAAAVGISALLKTSEDDVKWGDYDATQADIQSFVDTSMFRANVPTTISVIQSAIDTTKVKKKDVETALQQTIGDLNIINLGLANKDNYAQLRKDILGSEEEGTTGLVDAISGYIEEAKNTGKLTLQFTPSLVGDDKTDASEWFSSYTTGWDKVDQYAQDTGKRIGELLTKAEQGALEAGEPELLQTLMTQLNNVTEAVTKAKTNSEQFGLLQMNLGDLSQASFDDIVKYFNEYKTNLTDSYRALINEQYVLQGELVAALFEIDPNSDEYKKAKDKYDEMGRNLTRVLNESVEEASLPGFKWLTDFLLEKYQNVIPEISDLFESMDYGMFNPFDREDFKDMTTDELAQAINQWLIGQFTEVNEDLGSYMETLGMNAFAFLTDDARELMDQYLTAAFGEEKAKTIMERFNQTIKESAGGSAWEETKNAIAQKMLELFPDSNVDLLDRPILNYGDHIETLLTETFTASADGHEGLQWNQDLVMNLTPITPDGRKLTENEFNRYVEELLGKSTNMDDLFWNDRIENGGLGLLISADTEFESLEKGKEDAISLANTLHLMQQDYYTAGPINYSGFSESLEKMKSEAYSAFDYINRLMNLLGTGTGFIGKWLFPNYTSVEGKASGGFVKSGDLIMANENGNFEMMGKMGNQPVVANNQQIVSGITQGVATANGDVVSELRGLATDVRRILNKEFTVKYTPSATAGRVNQKSAEAYSRVTG